jgi:drug/metabolite transporter (DMT)-like permease
VCWWPFKQLESQGLHPLWATAAVYALVFTAMALWLWRSGQLLSWRTHPGLWLLLLASGLTNVGFNWAVTVGDVVRVVLLFYLMPAWSVLVAWWLLGEKPAPMALLRLLLALTGLLIVLKTPETPWPVPESLADVLALVSGFTFAVTNALLLKLKDTPSSSRTLAMFGGGAAMATLAALLGLAIGIVPMGHAPDAAWLPYIALLCLSFLLGNLALQYVVCQRVFRFAGRVRLGKPHAGGWCADFAGRFAVHRWPRSQKRLTAPVQPLAATGMMCACPPFAKNTHAPLRP